MNKGKRRTPSLTDRVLARMKPDQINRLVNELEDDLYDAEGTVHRLREEIDLVKREIEKRNA